MSTTLETIADNRRLRFSDDLQLEELDPSGNVLRQTAWESISGEKENEISFRFSGETRTSLAVKYGFNDRNQLTLQIVKQPGVPKASEVWTLAGKIHVDDTEDVLYLLLDDEGNVTTRKIEIYAKLDFPKSNAQLRVRFPDGTETFIKGAKDTRSLTASAFHAGGDLARDLLSFSAVTRNTVDGAIENMPADVKFFGRWDMHQNALVFVTNYANAGADPVGFIALAGQIKGTSFGLIVEQGGGAALQIQGRYEWNKSTLGWDLNVGFSKSAGIQARVGANAKIVGKNGTLTFSGGATLLKNKDVADFKLDLAVEYTTKGGQIVFKVNADAGGYELLLSGDFQIRNGFVKFSITAADKNGKKVVTGTVEFGFYTTNSDLKISLEAVLGPNGIELKLNLEFRFFWGPNGPVAELP